MTELMRWQPFRGVRRLHDTLDRIMDESLYGETQGWDEGIAPIDLYETDDEVVLKAAMPGVDAEDIDISISNGTLSLHAEITEEHEEGENGNLRYHIRERRYKRLARSMQLPSTVDTDKVDAEFDNGVLRLRMPKIEEAKSKTIKIKTK